MARMSLNSAAASLPASASPACASRRWLSWSRSSTSAWRAGRCSSASLARRSGCRKAAAARCRRRPRWRRTARYSRPARYRRRPRSGPSTRVPALLEQCPSLPRLVCMDILLRIRRAVALLLKGVGLVRGPGGGGLSSRRPASPAPVRGLRPSPAPARRWSGGGSAGPDGCSFR